VLAVTSALAGINAQFLSTPEFQMIRAFHDRRLQIAWEIHRWPELCPLEQRTFRAPYDETGQTAYPAGAEVLDPETQQYFQALQATTVTAVQIAGAGAPDANDVYQWNGTAYVSYLGYTIAQSNGTWVLQDNNGNQLYSNGDLTGAWGTVITGTAPAPATASMVSQPPTLDGNENSQYWAQCRTSYTADPVDFTATYVIGTQVQNMEDLNFYQRIVNTGAPDEQWIPANWGLLTVFERNVSFNQPWAANSIGEIMGAWDADPRVTTKLVKMPFVLDQDGAQFVQLRNTFNYGWMPASTNFSYVWILYRLQRPFLLGDAWNAALSYLAGAQVYYVSAAGPGNFYTVTTATTPGQNPDTTPASFAMVQIPYIFRQYLIEGGLADYLMANGDQQGSAAREAMAQQALELEADKLQRQQQQVRRFDWRQDY